jgi:transposase-like protein
MIQRMSSPDGISATALAEEVGVSQNTLSRWLREARTLKPMDNDKTNSTGKAKDPHRWTAAEKLRIVNEAAALSDEELGAFLRREGLHEALLAEWRKTATDAFKNAKKKRSTRTPEARRIKELERELLRKDRALAEVTALLALKKKVQEIWGDEGAGTSTRSGT